MSKLIPVTVNEALEMIKGLYRSARISICFSSESYSVNPDNAKGMLCARVAVGFGSHTVMIHFEGIEEVQRKKSQSEDLARLDLEFAIEILEGAQELQDSIVSELGIKISLSYDTETMSKFTYTINHAGRNESALYFADLIKGDIYRKALRKNITRKCIVLFEENEIEYDDMSDEAEQDR